MQSPFALHSLFTPPPATSQADVPPLTALRSAGTGHGTHSYDSLSLSGAGRLSLQEPRARHSSPWKVYSTLIDMTNVCAALTMGQELSLA